MKLLLDTHVALWWLSAHPRLDASARQMIAESESLYGNSLFKNIDLLMIERLPGLKSYTASQ